MINFETINNTAKAIGISPAATVQHWINEVAAEQRERDELYNAWRESAATVPQEAKSTLHNYLTYENGIVTGFDFDAIRANENDTVYNYACDQVEMWQDKKRIEDRYRFAWTALDNAGLLEVSEYGVSISQAAYDIAAGKLTDPFSAEQSELFADYDLTEEDLAQRGL